MPAAREAEQSGDLARAERAYEVELRGRPSPSTWERLGLVRHLQNKFESAIPAFREALRLDPSLWTSQLFLGIALYRTNQFALALASLDQAQRGAPPNRSGRDELDYWLGATHIALKQRIPGLQSLERLLARNPGNVDALELAVRTYADAASGLWNGVADRYFDTAPGWEVHGNALESEGNRAGALDAYRHSKALSPVRAGPGLAIGRLLLTDRKAEEALVVLRQELALATASPQASYYAGLAAIQLGRQAEAASLLETASRWPEQNPEAPLALAQVYLALHENEKAVDAARRAVALALSSMPAHELLVTALSQAGKTEAVDLENRRWKERFKK